METIECHHNENVRELGHGIELGECSICHQLVQYDRAHVKVPNTVTRLGHIEGKLVLPDPAYKLLLPPQDQADLATVPQKAPGGEITPRDAGWSKLNRREKAAHYRLHQKEIQHDVEELGEKAARKKWGIGSTTWSGMKKRGFLGAKASAAAKASATRRPYHRKVPPPPVGLPSGDLPPLPPWQDGWPGETQVKWLEIWEKLSSGKEGS